MRQMMICTLNIVSVSAGLPALSPSLNNDRVSELSGSPATFYSVGKIAKKNLATSSKNFSCYPSGHVFSYQ